MEKRIFRGYLLLTALLTLCLLGVMAWGLYEAEMSNVADTLTEETALLAQGLTGAEDEAAALRAVSLGKRVTLVAPDGSVLYDSEASVADMDNHLERTEVGDALANGSGTAIRRSGTLADEMVYYALRLPSGNVLRLAARQRTLWGHLLGCLPQIVLLVVLCLLAAGLLSQLHTKRLVKPITELNLEAPLDNDCYEELTPLLRRLFDQQMDNRRQLESIKRQKREQETILSQMREGLVTLNQSERVLSINEAAAGILGLQAREAEGRSLLELNRSAALREILSLRRGNKAVSGPLTLGGRHYHVCMNPVGQDDGWLLLLLDDTAEFEAQSMRREFTANVSHELRTPLTTISGCAEMLENGMVKPEDEREFAAKIHRESVRMLALVEDILRLSQLDEGSVAMNACPLDLTAAAEETLRSLTDKAARRGVSMTLTGEPAVITADPTLTQEILYNLADNAIKYNHEGGFVRLRVFREDGRAVFEAEDGGIGIPKEQQKKVFERFYRVDKSRSKATGGTGLGLSIVKHAAGLLGAEIELESELGAGTTVRVRFR